MGVVHISDAMQAGTSNMPQANTHLITCIWLLPVNRGLPAVVCYP